MEIKKEKFFNEKEILEDKKLGIKGKRQIKEKRSEKKSLTKKSLHITSKTN